MNKRIMCILVAIVLVGALGGCNTYEGPYIFFRQESGNIAKIQVFAYNWNTHERTLVAILAKEQTASFVNDLALVQCKQYFLGDHSRSYGRFQICITYRDGESELIGPYNIGYITADSTECLTNYYPASEQALWDLIAKYLDADALSLLR